MYRGHICNGTSGYCYNRVLRWNTYPLISEVHPLKKINGFFIFIGPRCNRAQELYQATLAPYNFWELKIYWNLFWLLECFQLLPVYLSYCNLVFSSTQSASFLGVYLVKLLNGKVWRRVLFDLEKFSHYERITKYLRLHFNYSVSSQ